MYHQSLVDGAENEAEAATAKEADSCNISQQNVCYEIYGLCHVNKEQSDFHIIPCNENARKKNQKNVLRFLFQCSRCIHI